MIVTEVLQWLLCGGGLVALISLPYAVKKAKSEAEGDIESRWKILNDELQEEVKELREQVTSLRDQVRTNERDIAEFREAVMTAYSCKLVRDNSECPVLNKYKEQKR